MVHISTGFIHPYRTDIDEIIYPMNEDPHILLEALEHFDKEIFEKLSQRILKDYPNNYSYTKSLAEYLLSQESNNLPIGK